MKASELKMALASPKTFCFDIDGVIATIAPNNDYNMASPIGQTVQLVNRLYDAGHRIVLFTARGGSSGKDWSTLTCAQMEAWGVKHHELRMGKPAADYYIDDKMLNMDTLLAEFNP